jgi:hypothetical protein
MKTKIIKLENDWKDVKNVSRTTVNKDHSNIEATDKFKMDILVSEHSPIRLIKVRWKWDNILSWVSVHWSRHKWECFISTRREDRTGVDRNSLSQNELVNMDAEANAQHLIDSMRKRLCYQASPETRELAEDLKASLLPIEKELSSVLVPNCVYRCGCPEFSPCPLWNNFSKHLSTEEIKDIRKRYEKYNEWLERFDV